MIVVLFSRNFGIDFIAIADMRIIRKRIFVQFSTATEQNV